MLITLYKIRGVHFRLLGTNGFRIKAKKEDLLLQARVVVRASNMKISRRRLSDYVKTLPKKRAARAARLFFFIQLFKSLTCGVVVDIAVIKS